MKKILSIVLAILVVMQSGNVAFAAESTESYYSKQETRTGENALGIVENENVTEKLQNIADDNNYEIVSATQKTVYVIETVDGNKNVIDSRLMTNAEVSKYKNAIDNGISILAKDFVGDDSQSHQGGKLDIYLVVYKDSSKNYLAYGTADWYNGIYFGGVDGPDSGYDFAAITWGGGGELKSTDYSCSGVYQYNQGNISSSKANSDTYKGYCWQFNDTKGAYFADYIDCYAKVAKTYSTTKNKETNFKFTYIHTYQAAVGSISFTAGSSGAAGGVSLSSCSKQWQIEVDVPGVNY